MTPVMKHNCVCQGEGRPLGGQLSIYLVAVTLDVGVKQIGAPC